VATQEQVRESIATAARDGDEVRVLALLHALLREAPTVANAQLVIDRLRGLPAGKPRSELRLAILRSFTVEPVLPLLKAAAALSGLDLEIWTGGFNTYAQELLNPQSDLYRFAPDVALLAVQTRDIVPEIWQQGNPIDSAAAAAYVDRAVGSIQDCVAALRSRSSCHLVLQNLELPETPSAGLLDAQTRGGQSEWIRQINRGLVDIAGTTAGVHVLDYDALISRHGKRRWHDERKWLTARLPIAAAFLMPLAQEYLRFLIPLAGLTSKVLVVDLDNTLWGGVVAEDGNEGIQVGPEYPGAIYLALQRAILAVRARGVLLAIASKNNEEDALEVLETHPGMLLRASDFVARRINWNDKAQSLREIASELNLAVDSIAFLDDSPIEREHIQLELPEVTVVELPDDPVHWANAVLECPALERLTLTDEDVRRSRMYAEQGRRVELQHRAASVEDFLRALDMKMEMDLVVRESVPRVAQLTQKTNQFNLTTRRYTEQELADLCTRKDVRVYQVRISDRFGENGIVGVAIVRIGDQECEIDTFLLSCRVIGRTIERAMLARIADDALAAGKTRLTGWFLETKKNQPASSFYPSHGFSQIAGGDGATQWSLELRANRPTRPDWVAVAEPVA
jgi:FkbH-like protein